MPWNETTRMDERCKLVVAYLSGRFQMSELCDSYRVSRPTGYKWVRRYRQFGPAGLQDRSRAPHHCAHRMDEVIAAWLLAERRAHPRWGPRKLLARCKGRFPKRALPARSTVAALLKRAGLSTPRRTRRACVRVGSPLLLPKEPNELWSVDFKGQFRTGDHCYCYPLTAMDSVSRYLLACEGQLSTDSAGAEASMEAAFRQYGLPAAIHSDNGPPFASTGIGGLSRLSVRWLKLGIRLHRSRPAHPEDNGAHERMHRTLKDETTHPPEHNLRAQQRRFNRFRREYNHERPHETLADRTPSQLYRASSRPYPQRIPEPEYPGHFEVRRVSDNGCIKWTGRFVFIGKALSGEWLGLEEIDDAIWSIRFFDHLLARFDERTFKLSDLPV